MIDARGYSCPTPVVMVQKEIKEHAPAALEVLVDNECALENVTRFGESRGYRVERKAEGADYRLTLSK